MSNFEIGHSVLDVRHWFFHQARAFTGGGSGTCSVSGRELGGPTRRSVTGLSRSPPEMVSLSPCTFMPQTFHTPSLLLHHRLSPTTRPLSTISPKRLQLSAQ